MSTAPGTLEVFVARAEARAILRAASEVTLHEAVDELQIMAERDGLVADIGQDAVQAIMAKAFASGCEKFASLSTRGNETTEIKGPDGDAVAFATAANDEYADLSFSFAAACRKADEKQRQKPVDLAIERARRLLADNISLERAWHENNARPGRVAETIIEALMFSLRDGVGALSRPDTLRRLSELDDLQLREVVVRLLQFKAKIAQPWTPEQVEILLAARSKFHDR